VATRKEKALDATGVTRDARRLRELLERGGATFRDVRLEPEARPLVRAFWETLGWSVAFEALALVPPELDLARARAEARLAEWRESGMARLTLAHLPERFRVIEDDGQGVGFGIADETRPGDEPPMRAVLCDTNRVSPMEGSYLRHVSAILVAELLRRRWPGAPCTMQPAVRGAPLLPALAPGLEELAPGSCCTAIPRRSSTTPARRRCSTGWSSARSRSSRCLSRTACRCRVATRSSRRA